jgi:hypothetical protein
MRLLLLLSALLASLGGVVSGAASAAAQVEASVSVRAPSDQATHRPAARFADPDAPAQRSVWHVAAAPRHADMRPLYADRLRE